MTFDSKERQPHRSLLKLPETECPQVWITPLRSRPPDPRYSLERNVYGNLLVGFLGAQYMRGDLNHGHLGKS